MRFSFRATGALLLALALGLLSVSNTSAHAELQRCTPAPDSVLTVLPKEIRCVFSSSLAGDKSSLAVFDAANIQVDNKDTQLDAADEDDQTLIVHLNTAKMPKGAYRVQWAVVSEADGDRTTGEWKFTLDVETGASTGGSTPTESAPGSSSTGTAGAGSPAGNPSAPAGNASAPPSAGTAPAPAVLPPPGPSAKDLPAGKGGVVARNYYGLELSFTINGSEYTVPANNWLSLVLEPGTYTYSANVFGDDDTEAMGEVEVKAGEIVERPFFLTVRKREAPEEGGEDE